MYTKTEEEVDIIHCCKENHKTYALLMLTLAISVEIMNTKKILPNCLRPILI